MQGFVKLIAASAVLSAGLVATLAAADGTRAPLADTMITDRLPASEQNLAWVDPPRKLAPVCSEAAWPYVPSSCLKGLGTVAREPARKVRIIAAEGRFEPGPATLIRVPAGKAPLAQR